MKESNIFFEERNKLKGFNFSKRKKKIILGNPKLGFNFNKFLLFFLIILLISSSLLIYVLLKRLSKISNNKIKNNMNNNHTKIKEKMNLSIQFSEIYSILYDTFIDSPKFSYGNKNHNFNIKENKGVGMCSLCKNENLYSKEFVTYYQKLGIKKIIIYDNNDIDGEKPEDVLQDFIKSNFIEIIDIRGFKSAQIPANNHCYKKYRNQFDYIAFFDFDEFLVIQNNKSINEYLYDSKFDKCESILLNWEMYGDSDLVKYDNRTMIERFTKPVEKWSRGKSIARTNIDNLLVVTVHNVGYNVNYFCDSNGNKIILHNYLDFTAPKEPESYIKHFYTKTAEEFCEKMKKGGGHINRSHPKYKIIAQNRIQRFKKFNKMTNEKRDIIKNCSGLMEF